MLDTFYKPGKRLVKRFLLMFLFSLTIGNTEYLELP